MYYDIKNKKWVAKAKPKNWRYYYEKDSLYYAGVLWALIVFMLGLVLGVGLMMAGLI